MNTQKAYRWMPVLLAMMGAMGWSAVARAGDADYDVPKQVVNYADLNLDSMVGAATLYRRIGRAAEQVCGGAVDVREITRAVSFGSCKAQAIARAVHAVNSSALTSLHSAKSSGAEKPITTARVSE
jgi:UrcA family protein